MLFKDSWETFSIPKDSKHCVRADIHGHLHMYIRICVHICWHKSADASSYNQSRPWKGSNASSHLHIRRWIMKQNTITSKVLPQRRAWSWSRSRSRSRSRLRPRYIYFSNIKSNGFLIKYSSLKLEEKGQSTTNHCDSTTEGDGNLMQRIVFLCHISLLFLLFALELSRNCSTKYVDLSVTVTARPSTANPKGQWSARPKTKTCNSQICFDLSLHIPLCHYLVYIIIALTHIIHILWSTWPKKSSLHTEKIVLHMTNQ